MTVLGVTFSEHKFNFEMSKMIPKMSSVCLTYSVLRMLKKSDILILFNSGKGFLRGVILGTNFPFPCEQTVSDFPKYLVKPCEMS